MHYSLQIQLKLSALMDELSAYPLTWFICCVNVVPLDMCRLRRRTVQVGERKRAKLCAFLNRNSILLGRNMYLFTLPFHGLLQGEKPESC